MRASALACRLRAVQRSLRAAALPPPPSPPRWPLTPPPRHPIGAASQSFVRPSAPKAVRVMASAKSSSFAGAKAFAAPVGKSALRGQRSASRRSAVMTKAKVRRPQLSGPEPRYGRMAGAFR